MLLWFLLFETVKSDFYVELSKEQEGERGVEEIGEGKRAGDWQFRKSFSESCFTCPKEERIQKAEEFFLYYYIIICCAIQ